MQQWFATTDCQDNHKQNAGVYSVVAFAVDTGSRQLCAAFSFDLCHQLVMIAVHALAEHLLYKWVWHATSLAVVGTCGYDYSCRELYSSAHNISRMQVHRYMHIFG